LGVGEAGLGRDAAGVQSGRDDQRGFAAGVAEQPGVLLDRQELVDRGVLVIDGGGTAGGAPSTIVDARDRAPLLIREGAIAWDRVLHSLQR